MAIIKRRKRNGLIFPLFAMVAAVPGFTKSGGMMRKTRIAINSIIIYLFFIFNVDFLCRTL